MAFTTPTLPLFTLDDWRLLLAYPATFTTVRTVKTSGGDYTPSQFQTALNYLFSLDGNLNHKLVVDAGLTIPGITTIPVKSGSNPTGTGWVVIESSEARYLHPFVRVSPNSTHKFAITCPDNTASILTANSAHHCWLIGAELTTAADSFTYSLLSIQGGSTLASLPHHIILDRCYLHGPPTAGCRRGVRFDGAYCAVVNSYVTNCYEDGADSQAIAGWNGSGPFLIENNFLFGMSENIMFGGEDTAITDNTPSDIIIRRNDINKFGWEEHSTAGTAKNLFELKHAQRVLFELNHIHHTWKAGQAEALVLTPRNQYGTNPWSKVRDVTVRWNWFDTQYAWCRILGGVQTGEASPTMSMQRILITQNLITGLGGVYDCWGVTWIQGSAADGPDDSIGFVHNTILPTRGGFILFAGPGTVTNVKITDNVLGYGNYGLFESGGNQGVAALNDSLGVGNWECTNNAWDHSFDSTFPANNWPHSSLMDIGMNNPSAGLFELLPSSHHYAGGAEDATDGASLGCDVLTLQNQKLAGVVSGAAELGGPLGSSVLLSWNSIPGVSGYKIGCSTTQGGPYTYDGSPMYDTSPKDVGTKTSDYFKMATGEYWFVIFSYDAGGNMSPASQEMHFPNDFAPEGALTLSLVN